MTPKVLSITYQGRKTGKPQKIAGYLPYAKWSIKGAYVRKNRVAQETAQIAAVSTFKVVSPKVTGRHPFSLACVYSPGVKSPSGPMRKEIALEDFIF